MDEVPKPVSTDIFSRLEAVILERKTASPEDSYVAELFANAPDSVSAKVIEEAYELVHASIDEEGPQDAIVNEAADLVFHVLVLLASVDVSWHSVSEELSRRFGISGQTEKASRGSHE